MRALTLYSFAIASLCFAALFLAGAYLSPRLAVLMESAGALFPETSVRMLPVTLSAAGTWATMAGLVLAGAGLLGAIVSRFRQRPESPPAAIAGIVLSATSLLWLMWEATTLFVNIMGVAYATHRRLQPYQMVLNEFALVEAAEGRHAALNEKIRQMTNLKPEPITNISAISPSDAKFRLKRLLQGLEKSQNTASAKTLLATTPLFAPYLLREKSTPEAASLLKSAQRITGKSFQDVRSLFAWLVEQSPKEYPPATLYHIAPPAD